jgi:hypothetical protein
MNRMRTILISAAIALAVPALASAASDASSNCSGYSYFTNRGGYDTELSDYRDDRGMACSSVRYVAGFLRAKISRQSTWPHIGGPFYDGYVTWHCFKLSTIRWRCEEYTTYTSFSFSGRVYG